jgi:hypothetical protein
MACDITDENCAFNLGKVADLAGQFGHDMQLYFMDLLKNKIYLRTMHQIDDLEDHKIGMYFKSH